MNKHKGNRRSITSRIFKNQTAIVTARYFVISYTVLGFNVTKNLAPLTIEPMLQKWNFYRGSFQGLLGYDTSQ